MLLCEELYAIKPLHAWRRSSQQQIEAQSLKMKACCGSPDLDGLGSGSKESLPLLVMGIVTATGERRTIGSCGQWGEGDRLLGTRG